MNRFRDVLTQLNDRLDLPQPARARILLEIAADLEDIYQVSREAGQSEEEARERAVSYVNVDAEALSALVRVHGSFVRRALDRVSEGTRTTVERLVLALVALTFSYLGVLFAMERSVFRDAGFLAWPLLALFLAGAVIAAERIYALRLKKDHRPRRLRRGLNALVALAGWQLALALVGSYLTLFATWGPGQEDPEVWLQLQLVWWRKSSALFGLATLGAVVCAFFWYFLARRVSRLEEREAALLLEL